MNILGIHMGHDASISIIKNNRLEYSSAVERFTRQKKDDFVPLWVVEKILSDMDMSFDDIDLITMAYWSKDLCPWLDIYSPQEEKYPLSTFGTYELETRITNHLEEYQYSDRTKRPELVEGYGYTLPHYLDRMMPPFGNSTISHSQAFKLNCKIEGYDRVITGYFVNHHTAHAASTFYTSPFKDSVIFTADASMHDHHNCSGYFLGYENQIQYFRHPGYMMGNFYDAATEWCGLGPGVIKAGVLMGLAAYGRVSKNAIDNWKSWTRPIWERNTPEDHMYVNWLFSQISGKYPYIWYPRPEVENNEPGSHFYTKVHQMVYTKEESTTQEVMDVAADIQYITERSLVEYSQQLYDETRNFNYGNLCTAGGIFLNCNANYKIMKETDFERMHIFPAAGDDGVSAGSALWVLHHLYLQPRETYTNADISYLGFRYPYQPNTTHESQDLDLDVLAKMISDGKIVCWYQGRSEFGPRALGNRSFITDPRRKEMKDILNSRVKFREWYRPFAPVVLNEYKTDWFDMDFESPFMLHTVPCKKPQEIPSAVHIDNTGRVQTLRREDNEKFYDLIDKFREITGVPVVMNTSLNIKGQPIVETPEDAMTLFDESDVDVLVINDKMYLK